MHGFRAWKTAVLWHLDVGSITVLCFRGEKTHDHITVRQRRIPQLEELLGGCQRRWLGNGNQIIKAANEQSLGHAGAVITYSPALTENAPREMLSYSTCIYEGGDVAPQTEGSQSQV